MRRARGRAELALAVASRRAATGFVGRVLVDGTWDNPNYWIRYALIRAALGLSGAREIGFVGRYNASACRRTFAAFGIREAVDITADDAPYLSAARQFLAATASADDVLRWQLPSGLPADFVYDGLLKRQRRARLDLGDPALADHVAEALLAIAVTERLLDAQQPDLILVSHTINFLHAALVWQAVKRGIPVRLLYGHYGVPRYAKIDSPADMYDWMDRPSVQDLAALPEGRRIALAAAGEAYLNGRRAGHSDEIGAAYAFGAHTRQVDRRAMAARFGWDPKTPLVAVYAPNWFDYPHFSGMNGYTDYAEWLAVTVAAAARNTTVNWLFRAHPVDARYGGTTLTDLMPRDTPYNIAIASAAWNGSAVMTAVDALVAFHSSAAIEYAAAGKPVLLADRGWFHDIGFAVWPRSREDYLRCLSRPWWLNVDLAAATQQARVFAGWYFCRPSWQRGLVLQDDSVQTPVWGTIPDLFTRNRDEVDREIATIARWSASAARHYHTYKMREEDGFVW